MVAGLARGRWTTKGVDGYETKARGGASGAFFIRSNVTHAREPLYDVQDSITVHRRSYYSVG